MSIPITKPEVVSNEQLLVDSHTAARMLCISERSLWDLQNTGKIAVVRIGRSVRFSREELKRFVQDTQARDGDEQK